MELHTLGSVRLDAPGLPEAPSVSVQPKRLAFLVYLAVARPHGPQRRDALLALFWPEADQERGRQVLRQTVYLLRQSLGRDVIVSRGDEDLQLDADAVTCDAVRFEAAISDGRLTEALDLYRGDFLHGFHAPGVAAEFEEWLAEERRRLRGLASTAAWTLATSEERAGHASGAFYWARRATQLDRDNEGGVRDLMRLHARLGDRVGAVRVYEEHVRRLQRDLGMEPGAELTRLAETLRSDAGIAEAPAGPRSGAPPAAPSSPAAPVPASRAAAPGAPWRRWLVPTAALAAIGVGALLVEERPRAPAPPLLAVGSIVDVTSPDSSAEAPVVSDLLATSLARVNGLQVIPEVRLFDLEAQLKAVGAPAANLLAAARQAGAARMLRGTLHRGARGQLSLDAQILTLPSGTVVRGLRVSGRDLFDLVDRTTDALAQIMGAPPPTVSIADVTTRSLVAYRLYQEALRAYYTPDVVAAQALFRAAEAEDSSFAMAAYYDGIIGMILGQGDASQRIDRAARLAQRAPDRERLLIRYRVAAQHQSADAAPLAETLSVRYPNDLDAIAAAAALRQRSGDWAGAAAAYRAIIRRDSLSLHVPTARCHACEAYVDLWWTYIYADSMAAAEATMREWGVRHGRSEPFADLLSIALERQGRFAEARALWRDVPPSAASLRRAQMAIRAGDLDAARDTLATLQGGTPGLQSELEWWLAIALRNQGQPRTALAQTGSQEPMRPLLLFEAERFREAAALSDAAARRVRADDPHGWPRRLPWQLVHVATALAAARDTGRFTALADSAERIGAGSFFGRDPPLHHYIRGLLWLARGDTARAAEALRASIWSWTDGYTRANYELAKAELALGRPREAVYPLQAALRGDLQSSNLYVTRTELHEVLARAFEMVGERDSAAAHYRLVVRAWAGAEPAFSPRRAHAAAFLAARAAASTATP